ncbi:MAG: NVEALA domain-containing protein [Tannerella sp.]|jgi:hypothetical protein|nr:NVEALA domain-containing protein [Tannerella sp.]
MTKKILGGIAIVAIAVATALSVNVKSNDNGLTELGLANAEALAKQKPTPGLYCECADNCLDSGSSACYKEGW